MVNGRFCAWVALAALVVLVPGAALAGSVEFRIVDREGTPLEQVDVGVRTVTASGLPFAIMPLRFATSDGQGVVRFSEVPAGTYRPTFRAAPLRERNLVPPTDNPYRPLPVVTVLGSDDTVSASIEIWRGARIGPRVTVDRGELPRVRVVFRSVDTGHETERLTDVGGYAEQVLVPGRWEVTVDPPPGFLLVGVELDGESRPGHAIVLDLDPYSPLRYPTWRFAAPAEISGRVTTRGSGDGPLKIVAQLLEPGPWIEAARERGGSEFRQVSARWVTETRYVATVPSGLWRVRPVGERLESSEPESAEVRVEPGAVASQDFLVRHREGGGGGRLTVAVRARDRYRVERAVTELWKSNFEGDPLERVGARRTDDSGRVTYRGLEAGDYLVVAGHEDFREVRHPVLDFDPEDDERGPVQVMLEPGATVRGVATDENERRVRDVDLTVERVDGMPAMLLEDEALRAVKRRRTRGTDTTGVAGIPGLYEGNYRASARMRGALAATRFVRVSSGGDAPVETLDLKLGRRSELELDLEVLPAASVTGTLVCHDGGPLPAATSLRLFPYDRPGGDRRTDPDLLQGATLALDDLPMSGPYLDRFLGGPVESGVFHLATRPTGFGLWTWAPGGEDRDDAAVLQLEVGASSDAGTIEIECGPVIELVPTVIDGAPLPDLRQATVRARVALRNDDPEAPPTEPRVELHRDRILLRDAPVGTVDVEIDVEHPHFLPVEKLGVAFEAEIERGGLVTFPASIASVGGALVVRAEAGVARLRLPSGDERVVSIDRGRARFAAVPPGAAEIQLCPDLTCESVVRNWQVNVEVARTITLR